MKKKIETMLKKYIDDVEEKYDGATYVWEGTLNKKIIMVRYSDLFNKLFCGIEDGNTYLTGDAKKKGNSILKKFEKQLQHLYLKELD